MSSAKDIMIFAQHFLELANKELNRNITGFSPEVRDAFSQYRWPGNIRELQNLMERLVVLNRSGVISVEDLPSEIVGEQKGRSIVVPMGMPLREVKVYGSSTVLLKIDGCMRSAVISSASRMALERVQ